MSGLVSIIMPSYNTAKFIAESIDSVLAQTYTDWELLIVDDSSTDGTAAIAAEYVQKDSRIQYYKNPQNMRLPRTLNRGFSLAKGAYLTWTSDDNYYYPTALEKMYQALESQGEHFAFASCDVINETGEIVEVIAVSDHAKKMIVGSNPVGACFLYSRKVYDTVGEYDPEMTLVEDFDYWQRICMKYEPVCISEKLYAYRWHDGALTSTMRKDQFNANLEKLLLKNISGFGKLDLLQKYYYYRGLYICRENLDGEENQYEVKYRLLQIWCYLTYRVPEGIKRRIDRLIKR